MDLNIEITSPEQKLLDHLTHNERIILSGKFGIGKSFFLNKYFESHSDKFISINLRPVNYVVSSNEDIFQLIKYDIIYELLIHNDEYELFNINPLEEATIRNYFIADNFGNILDKFFTSVNLIDKSILDLSKYIYSLVNEYEKFRHKHLDRLNQFKQLDIFNKELTNKLGGIYENDFISELINNSIEKLKQTGKRIILVIDDVDRIDPEHIFRIINVFGAHLDIRKNENKFLFDSTILVCDIKNIRGVFMHRYGKFVDFEGYIDKFYSNSIFYYDNITAIINWINGLENTSRFHNKNKSSVYTFLFFIITNMSINNLINLRSLIKLDLKTDELGNLTVNINPDYNLNDLLYLDIFYILKNIFHDTDSLVDKLNIMADKDDLYYSGMDDLSKASSNMNSNNRKSISYLERFIIPVITKSQAYTNTNDSKVYNTLGLKIEYTIRDYDAFLVNIEKINDSEPNNYTGHIPLWRIISEATSKLSKMTGLEYY